MHMHTHTHTHTHTCTMTLLSSSCLATSLSLEASSSYCNSDILSCAFLGNTGGQHLAQSISLYSGSTGDTRARPLETSNGPYLLDLCSAAHSPSNCKMIALASGVGEARRGEYNTSPGLLWDAHTCKFGDKAILLFLSDPQLCLVRPGVSLGALC